MRIAALLLLSACDAVFGLRGKVSELDAFSLGGVDACSETVGGNSVHSLVTLCLPNLAANPIPTNGIIDTGSDECVHIDMISMCAFISPNALMLVNDLHATGPMPLLLVADTIDIEGKVEVQSKLRAGAAGPSAQECPVGAAGLNGGGAGGSYNSAGGAGGASSAANVGGTAVPAPITSSMWSAERFVGGCNGGVGGGLAGGQPGFGGGAVYLAATTITIGSAGSINASGAAGLGAKGAGGGGGGGGAGGAIVFDTNTLTIDGSAFANGGGGGGAGTGGANGMAGSDGADPLDYDNAAMGGAFGGGSGAIGMNNGSAGATPEVIAGGGGGGGGTGYIIQFSRSTTTSSTKTSPPIETE